MAIQEYNIDTNSPKLDREGFKQIFDELYIKLCRHSLQFVRIASISEEIVQELFIYLWEHRDSINIKTSYKSYLYAAVKNKSIDYLRSKYANLQFVSEDHINNLTDRYNSQSHLEEEDLNKILNQAFEELPEKCYIVFSMSRFGDFSNKQIAEQLNISEKTVENQITIALKKIRAYLSKHSILTYNTKKKEK
jgi:RNA polymerase sigma-70 factor, ECF subfamily